MKRWVAGIAVALLFGVGPYCAQGAEGVEKPKHEKAAKPSPIKDTAYNAETKVLSITFTNGDVYEYAAVPKETADALAAAEHKGHFFHKEIKGKFEAKKVSSAPEKKSE
jgi:hypothetical protein